MHVFSIDILIEAVIAVSGRSHEMREDSYISYFLNR